MTIAAHRIRVGLLAAALAVVTTISYKPAWHGGFIWDDDYYVTDNALLVQSDGLRRIWFSLDAPSQYFPLTYTTFRIERKFWALDPTGYHLVNLFLHVANALLLWRLLSRLRLDGAFFAAAIFALHPVQVESVAWITERKNVLMGFFFLATVLAWWRFIETAGRRRWLLYAVALLLYALSLSAKTTACTLPVALMSILWWKRGRISARQILLMLPFIILAVGAGLLAIWWERYHQGTRGALFALGPLERVLVASHAIWFYLAKLFWPAKLTFIYPQWDINVRAVSAYLWLAATAVAVAVICFVRRFIGRGLEAALFFFAGTLAPVLGFIMLYTFRYTYVADHYQYLACIGPIVLATAGVAGRASEALWQRLRITAGVVILLGFATLTWRQSASYTDIETLWRTTIARNPQCWMAFNNLGIALSQEGRIDEAIEQYQTSLRFHPDYAQAHYNLGNALLGKGDTRGALDQDKTAIEIEPNDPDAHIAFANALLVNGDVDLAIKHYEEACNLNPQNADAHYNLGHGWQRKGDMKNATTEYEAALRINPSLVEAHLNLGAVRWMQRRERDAIAEYEQALASAGRSEQAQLNLAWALATATDMNLRNGPRAVGLAEQGVRSLGEEPEALRILAAAYAQDRQFDRATETATRALALAQKQSIPELGEALRRELELYERGSAFREP